MFCLNSIEIGAAGSCIPDIFRACTRMGRCRRIALPHSAPRADTSPNPSRMGCYHQTRRAYRARRGDNTGLKQEWCCRAVRWRSDRTASYAPRACSTPTLRARTTVFLALFRTRTRINKRDREWIAIIHHEQFQRHLSLRQDAGHRLLQIMLAVARGNDDREVLFSAAACAVCGVCGMF